MPMHSQLRVAAASVAALLLLAGTGARATQNGKHDPESAAKAADEGRDGSAGQKAAVDPAGRLRPVTPEEARALLEGVSRHVDQAGDGLTERYHPSGAVSIDLEDRFQSVTMARAGADGSVSTRCVTTKAEAERFLGQGAPAPARAVAAAPARPPKASPAPKPAPVKAAAAPTRTPALEEK
jgi:hypothetical protein